MTNHQSVVIFLSEQQANKSNWTCNSSAICIVFACVILFSWYHLCTYENFSPQQYSPYVPRKKSEHMRRKSKKERQTRTATGVCFLCLLYFTYAFALNNLTLNKHRKAGNHKQRSNEKQGKARQAPKSRKTNITKTKTHNSILLHRKIRGWRGLFHVFLRRDA